MTHWYKVIALDIPARNRFNEPTGEPLSMTTNNREFAWTVAKKMKRRSRVEVHRDGLAVWWSYKQLELPCTPKPDGA